MADDKDEVEEWVKGLDSITNSMRDVSRLQTGIIKGFTEITKTSTATGQAWVATARFFSGTGFWKIQNKIKSISNLLQAAQKIEANRNKQEQEMLEEVVKREKALKNIRKVKLSLSKLNDNEKSFEEFKLIFSSKYFKMLQMQLGTTGALYVMRQKMEKAEKKANKSKMEANGALVKSFKNQEKMKKKMLKAEQKIQKSDRYSQAQRANASQEEKKWLKEKQKFIARSEEERLKMDNNAFISLEKFKKLSKEEQADVAQLKNLLEEKAKIQENVSGIAKPVEPTKSNVKLQLPNKQDIGKKKGIGRRPTGDSDEEWTRKKAAHDALYAKQVKDNDDLHQKKVKLAENRYAERKEKANELYAEEMKKFKEQEKIYKDEQEVIKENATLIDEVVERLEDSAAATVVSIPMMDDMYSFADRDKESALGEEGKKIGGALGKSGRKIKKDFGKVVDKGKKWKGKILTAITLVKGLTMKMAAIKAWEWAKDKKNKLMQILKPKAIMNLVMKSLLLIGKAFLFITLFIMGFFLLKKLGVFKWLQETFEALMGWFTGVFEWVAEIWEGVSEFIDKVAAIFDGEGDLLPKIWAAFISLLDLIGIIIVGLWTNVIWPLIYDVLWTPIWNFFKDKIRPMAEYFGGLFGSDVTGWIIAGTIGIVAVVLLVYAAILLLPILIAALPLIFALVIVAAIAKALWPFADGGTVTNSGLQMVGEKGPEIVKLPNGSKVHSNAQSKNMMGGGVTNNITVQVQGRIGASDTEVRDMATKVSKIISREINRSTNTGTRG